MADLRGFMGLFPLPIKLLVVFYDKISEESLSPMGLDQGEIHMYL
jgi:hypothetical protein